MATNTCISEITYTSIADAYAEPFFSIRQGQADAMFNEGKTEYSPNVVEWNLPTVEDPTGRRFWVDHAAAQEFIDWTVATAATYNMNIVSTSIEDLPV